jgi:molecular chaperone GrpE
MTEARDTNEPLGTQAEDEAIREDALDPPASDEAPPAPGEPAAAPAGDGDAEAAADADPVEPDYKDRWMRAAADLENVRRRARRDVALAEGRGAARLARELLPALDNLDRALAAVESQPENADHHLTDGIRLVQQELIAALARVGIVQDTPLGETFDPHVHEAVAQHPVEGAGSGTIVEVFQAGYRQGDDVLRAAKVVVAA